MMIGAEIISTGMYVPPQIVTNHDLEKLMDTSDEWIQQRSGIQERHWVKPEDPVDCFTSDLALKASLQALEKANLSATDLDMILVATISPDHDFPGTACFLQAKLGAPGIAAIDVRQQCSGFLYGLSMAEAFIKQRKAKTVLLVGAEIHSRGMDRTTAGRDVSVLFGDGAGAVILKAKEVIDPEKDSCIYSTALHSDGRYAKDLWSEFPTISKDGRMVEQDLIDRKHFPQMNGKKVFAHATRKMAETLQSTLKENGKTIADIDLFIFHQANLRINQFLANELEIPEHKVFNTIQRFGNTTAATIPIGLHCAQEENVLKKGMLVASAAFGSGFTWASALYRF